MTDFVTLGNKALSKCGHYDFITSLTDNTKAANLLLINYESVRDAMLRAHPWNFATTRATLAPNSTTPIWGDGSNFFPLPSDCLRVLGTDDPYDVWSVEGGQLYYNDTTVNISYTQRITDPNRFDALFIEAYTTMLAITICPPLTDSDTKLESLMEIYEKLNLPLARSINGQEVGNRIFTATNFLDVRN